MQNIQLKREISAYSLFECEMRIFTCIPSSDTAFSWSDKQIFITTYISGDGFLSPRFTVID